METSSISDKFRFIDFFVLVFFLLTAFLGLYLFRNDLLRTIEARGVEPAGVIIIKNNIVQRRIEDRVLWDRLFVDSLVYPGDLIRAADLSSATININENEINLNENTLIRIRRMEDGEGSFQVELREGKLSVASGTDARAVMLNLLGRQVEIGPGTVVNAESSEEGIVVEVNEGSAVFIEEGQDRQQGRKILGGAMFAMDTKGVERAIPAAVVIRPSSNARYLKERTESLLIDFSWNRINLTEEDRLRLDISGDWNFARISHSIDVSGSSTQALFNAGNWYWRLSFGDRVLSKGQFTVLDAFGPALTSPVSGSKFRYNDSLPQLRFQWEKSQDASGYLVEISETPEFEKPQITRQTKAPSLILKELEEGAWYWRVKPLFPPIYNGEADFSSPFYFFIEKTKDTAVPVIEVPQTPVAVLPAPIRVRERESASVNTRNNIPVIGSSANRGTVNTRDNVPAAGSFAGSSAVSANSRYHTVSPGDTLNRISRQYYGNALMWERISNANNIKNPDLIYPQQVFIIP